MRRSIVVGLSLVSFAAASCSGDSGSTTASVSETVVLNTMPQANTTSTTADSGVDTSTTQVLDGPVYPLTGLPVTDEVAFAHPALVVKIDNHTKSRPQTGLGVADIVFEENVEGITRFAAVFQSQGADPVGPIRSGRTQDVALLGSFASPLFAWSGGNAAVTRVIANSDFINLSNLIQSVQKAGGFFRADDRKNPHDLYAQTSLLWTLAPLWAPPPPPQFVYRAAGDTVSGDASTGVRLDMDGVRVDWEYDQATASYLRKQDGEAHVDAVSGPISAQNVVVPVVRYQPSAADPRSPEAQTVGSGDVFVFTGGVMVTGTWQRGSRTDPFTLLDASGVIIELTPGRTWVELARSGAITPVSS